ncbi:MAG: hypothetical protein ACRDIV_10025, partial [Ktedonobacteraceae bacterium]
LPSPHYPRPYRSSTTKERVKAMRTVHLRIRCSEPLSEALAGDVEQTELIIESIVSTALLEAFDTVLVDSVMVQLPTEYSNENKEREANSVMSES